MAGRFCAAASVAASSTTAAASRQPARHHAAAAGAPRRAYNSAVCQPISVFHRSLRTWPKSAEEPWPVVFLHGLLGSHASWRVTAKQLALQHARPLEVIAPDLRNHGASEHSGEHSYAHMVADVEALLNRLGIDRAVVCGFSMGGKLAMLLALHHPERVERLVVVDAAPAVYTHSHAALFAAMQAVPLAHVRSRAEVEARLAENGLRDRAEVLYATRNLIELNASGAGAEQHDDALLPPPPPRFAWSCNLPVLAARQHLVQDWPAADVAGLRYAGDTLFVGGLRSSRLTSNAAATHPAIAAHFPRARIEMLDAGHFVHAERPKEFLHHLLQMLPAHPPPPRRHVASVAVLEGMAASVARDRIGV